MVESPMRDCLVLGAGRSGTSLVSGILHDSGYWTGDNYIKPRISNPTGFFEDSIVNEVNEELIAQVLPARPEGFTRVFFRQRLGRGERWLAEVPIFSKMIVTEDMRTKIEALVSHAPFSLKDPRFCYTLPAWRPYLGDAAFVCVFRDPTRTARSICDECRRAGYLHLRMTPARAMKIWNTMYLHVLQIHKEAGDWLFLHYDQVLKGTKLKAVEDFLGTAILGDRIDPGLDRSSPVGEMGESTRRIYGELCELSGYEAHP